jgi:hypothetical protein
LRSAALLLLVLKIGVEIKKWPASPDVAIKQIIALGCWRHIFQEFISLLEPCQSAPLYTMPFKIAK